MDNKVINNNNRPPMDNRRPMDRKPFVKREDEQKKNLLEEKVIDINRVTKVTKGGRHFRFSATVVVGNRKGLVGIGTGKANEVPEAIKKGIQAANKNVVKVALVDARTIPHEAIGKVGRAEVLVKPAKEGRGVIAGGAARAVVELAGIKDIVSKSLGSQTKINVAKATLEALKMQKTPVKIAILRGKIQPPEPKVKEEPKTEVTPIKEEVIPVVEEKAEEKLDETGKVS